MKKIEIPIWEKYALTIDEAALYFRIGENAIRRIINENQDANFWFMIGNRKLIKRVLFEEYMNGVTVI
ncbi:MAG: excisionase [Ruminococcaceae bacterium]|nr:excisionase [Oscillospiraceae bacterium]